MSKTPVAIVGVDPASAGLARAASYVIDVSAEGVEWLLRAQ
jgi:acetaldehyde dehydrogenase (acetylating)